MKVNIKKFEIDMEVKTNGMELEVRTPDGISQLGDLKVTKSGLEWCKGRREKGKKISWEKFINYMEEK